MNDKSKLYAALATAAVAAIAIVLMLTCHLSLTSYAFPHEDKGEIVFDEEFIDIVNMPSAPNLKGSDEALAKAEEQTESQPTPASGSDREDAGEPGDVPEIVTSKDEAPAKATKPEKTPEQIAAEKKKKEQEEIKRKANNDVANAFSKSSGNHNALSGSNDKGNSGKNDGKAPTGTLTGHGTGTAGGGWGIPAYAAVQSTVTGSVKMVVSIDRQGNVTSLRFEGGDAPAATNTAVKNACAAEVRSRKFTRANYDNAPETSTAYITYTFK